MAMTNPSLSVAEIYARRKAAVQARFDAQPQRHTATAKQRAASRQALDAGAIYARRRAEAQARGRAAGYVR